MLNADWTCFDAARYGALLVVDPEDSFFSAEAAKLVADVVGPSAAAAAAAARHGLGLVVLADWHSADLMAQVSVSVRRWRRLPIIVIIVIVVVVARVGHHPTARRW